MKHSLPGRFAPILTVAMSAVLAGGASRVVQDQCGPFTDVTPGFCPYILEIYYLGITVGTSPTTFSPDEPLTRGQGAVFIAKGINQTLARSSRRAALGQWWTTKSESALGLTTVGLNPAWTVCDGEDVWVTFSDHVTRVHASDGRILDTWTGATQINGIVAAMGKIFVTGFSVSGNHSALFRIDPAQPAGPMTEVASLAADIYLAFDGSRFWSANGDLRSVSITTPGPALPWPTTTVTTQDVGEPQYLVFDGTHMWASIFPNSFAEFDENGGVLQQVFFPDFLSAPGRPVFDGANFWIPDYRENGVIIVRASDGTVLTTLTGKGLVTPALAAFDGTRVLVTAADGVWLWNAADLSPIGFTQTGAGSGPYGVSSDGINFWIPLEGVDQLARF